MKLPFLALCVSLAPALACADATTEAELRGALQNATNQIASLEDQVANLQAQQAPQAALITSLEAKLATSKPNAAPTESVADKAKQAAALAALNRRLAGQTAALQRAQADYAQAASSASAETASATSLTAQLGSANHTIAGCDAKNAALYQLGNQILDAYSHKDDLFGAVANREPFIGFKRVQLQNIVQDDQDKLYSDQVNP